MLSGHLCCCTGGLTNDKPEEARQCACWNRRTRLFRRRLAPRVRSLHCRESKGRRRLYADRPWEWRVLLRLHGEWRWAAVREDPERLSPQARCRAGHPAHAERLDVRLSRDYKVASYSPDHRLHMKNGPRLSPWSFVFLLSEASALRSIRELCGTTPPARL